MKVKKLNENFELIDEIETPEVTEEKAEVVEDVGDLTEKALRDYREFANIDEAFEITAENIDSWALNEAANKNGLIRADLQHMLLGENITIDQASRALETEAEMVADKTVIETELDKSLKRALWMQKRGIKSNFPNKLFVSQPGAGKTSIIYQWAAANNVNIVYKDCKTMDLASLGGILTKPTSADDPYAGRLATKEFHVLDQPRTVLFLDELNRAPGNIQGSLLTLINDHVVWDPSQPGERRFLLNFLFTVAAINPPSLKDPALKPLGTAMSNRFKRVPTPGKAHETLRYLRKYYADLLEQEDDPDMIKELKGKLKIAEAVLSNPRFTYDTAVDEDEMADDPSYQSLSPRSFVDALENSDGTKQGFLDEWNDWCNYKKKHTIEDILGDFVDIEDEANAALKVDSASSVFSKEMSARAKLKNAFSELNI